MSAFNTRLLISFIATGLMLAVMITTDLPLRTVGTPLGIFHLEFAYNAGELTSILKVWQDGHHGKGNLVSLARLNTYLDFLFLTFYGYLLFCACRFMALKIKNGYGKLGLLMAKLAIMGAVFDIVENVFMLAAMDGVYGPISLLVMAGAAAIKWTIVILAITYILGGIALLTTKLHIRKI